MCSEEKELGALRQNDAREREYYFASVQSGKVSLEAVLWR